ncbi:MAG: AraC family transcriptional regulator [Verrucomicrobiales bacterium]
MKKTSELAHVAQNLATPSDYFAGLDWSQGLLPRNVLAFSRQRQQHEVAGWEGISARTGRYDQHSRFVLLYLVQGDGDVGVETQNWKMREGDAFLMFPHQVHYYLDLPEDFCWLYITFDLETEHWAGLDALRSSPRRLGSEAEVGFERFLKSYQVAESQEDIYALCQRLKELLSLVSHGEAIEPVEQAEGVGARVREFVFNNIEGDLAVATLAEKMDCSGSYLRERFREEVGVSLGHFVRSVRLVRATHLLREGIDGVGDIAVKCGFNSFSSFSRAFSRVYGMSPSEYRKVSGGRE